MSFNLGQIIEGVYTIECAEWCNSNNCYLEEIEPLEDGTRRFEIKENLPPEPHIETEEEKKERISKLYMTRSDFFDGTIMAWGVGQDELQIIIGQILDSLPIENFKKMIAINNFRNALNFYRKHELFNLLLNIPIKLSENLYITITSQHWDNFFEQVNNKNPEAYKELPVPQEI